MRACSIANCGEPVHGKGLCNTHYAYQRRTGQQWQSDVGQVWKMEERFWPKVEKGADHECWNWLGSITHHGYGSVGRGGFRKGSVGAHRASYELHYGPIPKGKLVMHTCDNRACVNPAHLLLGTHKENTQDMLAKGRHRFQTPRGEKSSLSRLTEAQVRFIRKHTEISLLEMARAMNVGHCAIWRIRTRRTWTHID